MLIRPITARLVRAEHASDVVVPSFDALSEDHKTRMRSENPLTFLHAMHEPHGSFADALNQSRNGLERLVAGGAFTDERQDVFFVYRMTHARGAQTGLVCGIPASSFRTGGEVLPHEAVQPGLVSYLAQYLAELGVASSPVKATFRTSDRIEELIATVTSMAPVLDFGDASDLRQEVWEVAESHDSAAFVEAFRAVDRAYVTDGHHRSAAALHLSETMPVLTVLFPDRHLTITQFNRTASDVPLEPLQEWLSLVGARRLEAAPDVIEPGSVGVFSNGNWHVAQLPKMVHQPPESLDPSVLQDHVLGPILGITEPGRDQRLQFVPGSVPLDELAARAGSGVAFALAPVRVSDVMEVAERGLAMPAKSTYFEPKARSGIFLMGY